MGRIRTIKPEILTDGKAAKLSDAAWRLWVSSWLIADDLGRFPADPLIISGQILPGRVLSEISVILTEVSNSGLISLYLVNGEQYGQINGWEKHQKINRPSGPKFPAPCDGFIEDSRIDHDLRNADHDRRSSESEDPITEDSRSLPVLKANTRPRSEITADDLEEAYSRYPLKKGKAAGMAKAKKTIRTLEDFEKFAQCIEYMATAFARDNTYCPHFSTFVNKRLWEDETWPSPGSGGGKRSSVVNASSFLEGLED